LPVTMGNEDADMWVGRRALTGSGDAKGR